MKKFLLLLAVIATQLAAIEAGDVLDRTIKQYRDMKSFYAEFEQVFCDEEAGICQRYEGRTYYMKPNFFRMEIDEPKQIFVGDSVSLWIYFPDDKRVIRQGLERMPFQINPDALLADYEKDYDAQIVAEDTEHYEIQLHPKEETDVYRKLTVKIRKKTYEIIGIVVYDDAGSENKFDFTKVEINKKLSKKLFEFNPPKGVQIDEF